MTFKTTSKPDEPTSRKTTERPTPTPASERRVGRVKPRSEGKSGRERRKRNFRRGRDLVDPSSVALALSEALVLVLGLPHREGLLLCSLQFVEKVSGKESGHLKEDLSPESEMQIRIKARLLSCRLQISRQDLAQRVNQSLIIQLNSLRRFSA